MIISTILAKNVLFKKCNPIFFLLKNKKNCFFPHLLIRYLQFFHYLFQSLYNSVSTIGYRTWQIWWRRQIIDSGLRDSFGGQPRRGLKIKKNHQESKLIQVHACLADSRPVLTTSSKNVVVCTILHSGLLIKK